MDLTVYTDGGARGNPGPAAIGVVVQNGAKTLASYGGYIGEATNNIAEYQAVISALTWIKNHISGEKLSVRFIVDSTLVANQLSGLFKIKSSHLRTFVLSIRMLEQEIGGHITYTAVPREQNILADMLVNKTLDSRLLK